MTHTQACSIDIELEGVGPMLMHNPRLANPLDPLAQQKSAISGKRKKTIADHEALQTMEMQGSLYWSDQLGIFVPDRWIEGTLIEAGKKRRLGQQVKAAVQVLDVQIPFNYAGKQDVTCQDDIVENTNYRFFTGVVIKGSRVFTTRPIFKDWSLKTTVMFNPEQINESVLIELLQTAGALCGIGGWRPKFGKFNLTAVNGQPLVEQEAA